MTEPRSRTFEWQDPMAHVAGVEGKSGLAFLHAILAGDLPPAPISQALGFVLAEAREGYARFRGVPEEYHYNPMGSVHGGYACTLLDSALGCAVMTVLDEKTAYTTVQIGVHLTRPITKDTGPIDAEARIVHRGGRMATAEATLKDQKGALLAHATTTCIILPRK
jgi:uncharacterized protein (TIGR00369 family)